MRYETLRDVFRGKRLPLAFIDLQAFDANVAYVAEGVQGSGKTVRLGTKSIRCEPLLRRILDAGPVYQGFLTYTVEETKFLADRGHDDFLVAYPTVQPTDLLLLTRLTGEGKRVSVMVDSHAHLAALGAAGTQAGVTLSACLEVDLAYRPLPGVHLGLRRSPVRTPEQAVDFVRRARDLGGVRVDALMGYEGHIAGTSDALPGRPLQNLFLRAVKAASVRELTRRRGAVVRALREAGVPLRLVNGGGSGSLVTTIQDASVTEVTVGSGFLAPGLFHHFAQVRYQPSAFFALQVVRKPAPAMIACAGGGYVASGPTGPEKAPLPAIPAGLRFLALEGAGEVSTPLILPRDCPDLRLGDPVFFQHAKAGELCERFDSLHLLRDGRIIDAVATYRGEGMNFM